MKENFINVRVWGDFACFTRPEMKVERVSYPLMTPSAARGILEAVFWKPEMYYLIDTIRVVKKVVWTSFRRNEITKRISVSQAKSAMQGTGEISTVEAGGGAADATQRNMLALRDVEYIISAEIRLSEIGRRGGNVITKYTEEAKRRINAGKCFHRPALGVREFAADFDLVENVEDFNPENLWSENLGLMLYDVFAPNERAAGFKFVYDEDSADAETPILTPAKKSKTKNETLMDGVLVKPSASFFHAEIKDSVMDCHPERVSIIHRNGGAN
ncbi:MAG: type I-C CRISPR-associated protein Cas5c [Pyrinomonadaceae bacterium]